MCGRFTLTYKTKELQLLFGLPETTLDWQPRYNIAPSQPIAAILDNKSKNIEFLRWGLIPGWAKDITIGNRLINARSETIMEKPSFKNAFKRRRCLILADGFYEWKRSPSKGGSSTPFYFYLEEKQPFAIAGIWEIWHSPEGSEIWSAAIITCDANEILKPVHERMPVILDKEMMFDWLEDRSEPELVDMMRSYPSEKMRSHQVGKAVNSPFNDIPEGIQERKQNNSLF